MTCFCTDLILATAPSSILPVQGNGGHSGYFITQNKEYLNKQPCGSIVYYLNHIKTKYMVDPAPSTHQLHINIKEINTR